MKNNHLAQKIYKAAYITGDFLLRSGQRSKEYFDKYRFESNPLLLKEIAIEMAKLLPANIDGLAGLEVGGIPIATAISLETGLPVCFVRKTAKEYGTCQFAEGFDVKGKKLCIIEDVVTSGGQVILSTQDLRKNGALIENVICVIDREQGGRDQLNKIDLNLKSLFTMSELKGSALNQSPSTGSYTLSVSRMKYSIEDYKKAEIKPEDVCYVFSNNKILIFSPDSGVERLPTKSELHVKIDESDTVFKMSNGWALSGESFEDQRLPKSFQFKSLRDVLGTLALPIAKDASVGAQFINWSSANKFCGHCGKKLTITKNEIAKNCNSCERNIYPQLSPVIITLIKRGRQILLVKGVAPKKYYSCVAGFVEPGEALEESLRREVQEEVGIEVKNIKYFGSQPWPFPNNLMVGFTAEWIAGDIKVDGTEITDAQWFDRDQLPEDLPPRSSISRMMIEAFKKAQQPAEKS